MVIIQNYMQGNKRDLSNVIKQGKERRREEKRKKSDFQKEYLEELENKVFSQKNYFPNTLIGLFFIGTGLCEEQVDWGLVCVLAVVNVFATYFPNSPSSWLNLLQTVMFNIVLLVYFSPEGKRVIIDATKSLTYARVLFFLSFNLILFVVLYCFYVKGKGYRRTKQSSNKPNKESSLDDEIEKFKEDVNFATRLDYAACAIVLANALAFILLGFIPLTAVWQSYKTLTSLLV